MKDTKFVTCSLCHIPIQLFVIRRIKNAAYIVFAHNHSCPVTLGDLGYVGIDNATKPEMEAE